MLRIQRILDHRWKNPSFRPKLRNTFASAYTRMMTLQIAIVTYFSTVVKMSGLFPIVMSSSDRFINCFYLWESRRRIWVGVFYWPSLSGFSNLIPVTWLNILSKSLCITQLCCSVTALLLLCYYSETKRIYDTDFPLLKVN